MFFSKQNIKNYIIALIISINLIIASCYSQGIFLLEDQLKKITIGKSESLIKKKIGSPLFCIKEEDINIYIYYYLDHGINSKNIKYRRCVLLFFKNQLYEGYKIY